MRCLRSVAFAASLGLSTGFIAPVATRSRALRSTAARRDDDDGANEKLFGRREWAISLAGLGFTAQTARAAEESTAVPNAQAAAPATAVWAKGFPSDVVVPYKGSELPLRRFRAKATVVVNIKTDDPESTRQLPALAYLSNKYAKDGLRVLAFPTEQGWYEPEVSDIVRIRALQTHGFGAFPIAVVFDKVDLLGKTAHPLYSYLMNTLRNPNGRAAVSLNFEKFLLDETGLPVRRYPRKYDGYQMERDVEALLAGQPLPPESDEFLTAWVDADREAIKSEYAFRMGYNLYKQESASRDWNGIAEGGFR